MGLLPLRRGVRQNALLANALLANVGVITNISFASMVVLVGENTNKG